MPGFDPSSYLGDEEAAPRPAAEPTGQWSDVGSSPPVAGVAATKRLDDGTLIDEKTGEILDAWAEPRMTVAGVAAVADLPLTAPFARELNGMFGYPPPRYVHPRRWRQLCQDARKFAEGKAVAALEAGWEPLELFGYARDAWTAEHGIRPLGTDGIVSMLRGRGVGEVTASGIEIINRVGAHNRAHRAHFMSAGRNRAALMWESFHPSNVGPPNAYRRGDGTIVDVMVSPFGLPPDALRKV